MTKAIRKMKLCGFRGASTECEITFDTSKSLVIIFGENGTGKSTLADAIDFIANGSPGSLEDRSVGSSKITYLQTVGRKPSDLRVEVEQSDATWIGTISAKKANVTGTGDRPRARVLRRARLLRLVEAQPAERYKELQSFIDVAPVEAAEQALRDAARRTLESANTAVATLTEAIQALEDLWVNEGSPGESANDWAEAKCAVDQAALQGTVATLDVAVRSLTAIEDKRRELIQAEREAAERAAAVASARRDIEKLPSIAGHQAVELVSLLANARTVVEAAGGATSCPVCEQSIDRADLLASLSSRLSSMTQHQEAAAALKRAETALEKARGAEQAAAANFVKAVQVAAKAVMAAGYARVAAEPVMVTKMLAASENLSAHIEAARLLQARLAAVSDAVSKEHSDKQADLNRYNAIKAQLGRIAANTDAAKTDRWLAERLDIALKECERTRREYTQAMLDGMQAELNDLYSQIHPNESLGPLRLAMDPKKKGSIEQDATFNGHSEVPPQAYFSESHLDTLGFCVWLVLAKRENPKNTVIVLDDVFTSVDAVHLTRIISLLSSVAPTFAQVIVMTHYRSWRDRYRFARGPGLSVQLLELNRWTITRGVTLSRTKLAVDQLEAALNATPFDRQAVASQAGILLEAVLERIAGQYRLRLPYSRDADYTLGDLLNGAKKLFDVLAVERPALAQAGPTAISPTAIKLIVQPFFQEMGQLSFIRNQVGCHFNIAGAEVADEDVEAFGRSTVAMVRALTCNGCGDLPQKEDGTHFRCTCKRTRMAPLKWN